MGASTAISQATAAARQQLQQEVGNVVESAAAISRVVGEALGEFAARSNGTDDATANGLAAMIAEVVHDMAELAESAADIPDYAFRQVVEGGTVDDFKKKFNDLVAWLPYLVGLAQDVLGDLHGTCNATAQWLCETYWKPTCEPPMVPDPPCEYVFEGFDPNGPSSAGAGGGGAHDEPDPSAEAAQEGAGGGGVVPAPNGRGGGKPGGDGQGQGQQPGAEGSEAGGGSGAAAGITVGTETPPPSGATVETASGPASTGGSRSGPVGPSGGVGSAPGFVATSQPPEGTLVVCEPYVTLAKNILTSLYAGRRTNPPESVLAPGTGAWAVADAAMLEEFKKKFTRDGGRFNTGGACVQLVVVGAGTGPQHKRATASPAGGEAAAGTAPGPVAGPVAAPDSSADGGSVAGPGEPPAAAPRETAPGLVSPGMPDPCELYWRVAWQVLASAYGNRGMTRPEPMVASGVLVVVVVDSAMQEHFAKAFRSDQLVRQNLEVANACVRVVLASATAIPARTEVEPPGLAAGGTAPTGGVPGAGPSIGPAGSRADTGSASSAASAGGVVPTDGRSVASPGVCVTCPCALVRLRNEGEAKTDEGRETQIDYLWAAAHNTVVNGKPLTDGLHKGSPDRRRLAVDLVERCSSVAAGAPGSGGSREGLIPHEHPELAGMLPPPTPEEAASEADPDIRAWLLYYLRRGATPEQIEETKLALLAELRHLIARLEGAADGADKLVRAFVLARVEYEALLRDPNADPAKKEMLRLFLSYEGAIEKEARLYVAARLRYEAASVAPMEEFIKDIDASGSPEQITEIRKSIATVKMVIRRSELLMDQATVVTAAIDRLEAARLTTGKIASRIFWPVTTAEYVFPGGDKPWLAAPSSVAWGESKFANVVTELLQEFSKAKPWAQHARKEVSDDDLARGFSRLEEIRAANEALREKSDKARDDEWRRLQRWMNVADVYALVSVMEGMGGLSRLLPPVYRFLFEGGVRASAQVAASTARRLFRNPTAALKGGYQALLDSVRRGARLGTAEAGAAGVGRTASVAQRPPGSTPVPGAGGGRSAGSRVARQGGRQVVNADPKGARPPGSSASPSGLPDLPGKRSPSQKPGTTVIGHYPEYVELADELGANRFSIPKEQWDKMTAAERWAANQASLDEAIARGDTFKLATPIDKVRPGSYFEKEVNYLTDHGYQLSRDGVSLLPPGGSR